MKCLQQRLSYTTKKTSKPWAHCVLSSGWILKIQYVNIPLPAQIEIDFSTVERGILKNKYVNILILTDNSVLFFPQGLKNGSGLLENTLLILQDLVNIPCGALTLAGYWLNLSGFGGYSPITPRHSLGYCINTQIFPVSFQYPPLPQYLHNIHNNLAMSTISSIIFHNFLSISTISFQHPAISVSSITYISLIPQSRDHGMNSPLFLFKFLMKMFYKFSLFPVIF